MKIYDEIPRPERGAFKGIITDAPKGHTPENAVYNSSNFDFTASSNDLRKPLVLEKDYNSLLPADYSIIAHKQKQFTDHNANKKTIRFLAAKDLTDEDSELKIYADGYYCPDTDAENAYTTTEGFNTDFIELTERYDASGSIAYTQSATVIDTLTYNLRTDSALLDKPHNYFKGFFFKNEAGEVIGIIDRSYRQTSSGTYTYQYFHIDYGENQTTGDNCSIARFQVNHFNRLLWPEIDQVTFLEQPSGLQVLCNNKAPILSIDFLNNRNNFGGFTTGTITGDLEPYATVTGLYTGDEEITYEIKVTQHSTILPSGNKIIELQWRAGSTDTWKQIYYRQQSSTAFDTGALTLPNNIYVKFIFAYDDVVIDDIIYIPITKSTLTTKWDGFYFGYNTPQTENKKEYLFYQYGTGNPEQIQTHNISPHLGIFYRVTAQHTTVLEAELKAKIYSLAIQFNRDEIFFLKNIVSAPSHSPADRNTTLSINLMLTKAYDRRITAHLIFFQEYEYKVVGYDDDYSHNNTLPPTHLLDDISKGINSFKKAPATLEDNNYKIPIVSYDESTNKTLTKEHAKGSSLLSYLNQYYYNDITVNASKAIVVGEHVLLYDVETSHIKIYVGKIINDPSCYVCLAQTQKDIITANRSYSIERTLQLTKGEAILAISVVTTSQLLILTATSCYQYEIRDFSKFILQETRQLELEGIINPRSLVTAQVKSQYGGTFWINHSGIHRFFNSKIVNTLKGKIQDLFDTFTKEQISAAFGYFEPIQKQVYYYIAGKLLIYNIELDHYKIYEYPVTPEYFENTNDGDIIFSNNRKIYRQERQNSDNYLDLGTTGITGYIEIYSDNKNPASYKIPHRLELHVNAKITDNILPATPDASYLTVKVSGNDNTNDIENRDINIGTRSNFNIIFKKRKTVKYSKLRIETKAATTDTIKRLRIIFQSYINKVTGKYIGKQ